MRPLRVLHLPVNIRWIMDHTIDAQQNVGIETKKILISPEGVNNPEKEVISYMPYRGKDRSVRKFVRFSLDTLRYFWRYTNLVLWADVIHWQYGRRMWIHGGKLASYDFWLINFLKKPFVVQFHGGDFTNFHMLKSFNPLAKLAWDEETMSMLSANAKKNQKDFSEAGALMIMGHVLLPYVEEYNKDQSYLVERMMDVEGIYESFNCLKQVQKSSVKKLRILHAPSHPTCKGTQYIIPILQEVSRERNVEYELVENISHSELLHKISKADIVIDQILHGEYGLFAVEGLAMGKSVIAYVHERFAYSDDLPIVSATPDTLRDELLRLIDNSSLRDDLRVRGVEYAFRTHSKSAVLTEVLKSYRLAAGRRGRKRIELQIDYYLIRAIKQFEDKRSEYVQKD